MKFFPEALVPDPDKKIDKFDKLLINKVIEELLKHDTDLRLIKQEHRVGLNFQNCTEIIQCNFEKGIFKYYIEFCKLSSYGKKDFNDDPCTFKILNTHALSINSIKDDNSIEFMNMQNKLIDETKKFCGLKINIHLSEDGKRSKLLGEEAFAVGSKDTIYGQSELTRRVDESALKHLDLYKDWIIKKLVKNSIR